MKKLLFITSLVLSTVVMADSTCMNFYKKVAEKKHHNRQLFANEAKKEAIESAQFVGPLIVLSAVPVLTPFVLPIAASDAVWGLAAEALYVVFQVWDNNLAEQKVLDYKKDPTMTKGYLHRTLIKAQQINPNIQPQDIEKIIEDGFESGDFCADQNHLLKPAQIQEYVLMKI